MFLHVVLFTPRADLTDENREDLLRALAAARREIPGIRRLTVGRRLKTGRAYDATGDAYSYAAVIEFDRLDDLQAYLDHPSHDRLGTAFRRAIAAGLICDFETLIS